MADLLIGAAEGVKSQFSWKEVDSSNTVFKLFAKASVGLCLLASILVASAEYLGKPITCEHGTDKILDTAAGTFTAYCWIHGGKKLTKYGYSQERATGFGCTVNDNTVSSHKYIYNLASRKTGRPVRPVRACEDLKEPGRAWEVRKIKEV